MLEAILTPIFEPIIRRLTIAVRRHVFPSLGVTVLITIFFMFGLLNPWFGSQNVKAFLISYMVGGSDDVEFILRRAATNKNSNAAFLAGAERAGFYTSSNKAIVDKWSEDFSASNYTNQKTLGEKYSAIIAARERAELHEPPFQLIGLQGTASSPSCEQTRPPTNQVYLRANSYIASRLNAGDYLKITRQDGLGRPVIAVVNKIPDMPSNVDIYMNRRQMIDYLAATEPVTAVRAVITDQEPNQDMEDRYPRDVKIDCKHG